MNEELAQKAESLLSSVKLRRTIPRMAVLSALIEAGNPHTAEDIEAYLESDAPNKVTIYRTLETLVRANLVHKVFLHDRTQHFELAHNCTKSQCHPHFTCTQCDQTHCLTDISVPMAERSHKGFIIEHQRVQFEGLCPQCSEKPNISDI